MISFTQKNIGDAPREDMMIDRRSLLAGIASGAAAIMAPHVARTQEVKHYRFAYDQPKPTGYGILGDIFANRLKELSKGTMLIDQYPGAQLGQEPQVLQLVKSGDIEFCISSSANAATVSPQAGVMSLHYLFRSEDHLIKAMADPKLSEVCKAMIADSVQGARIIALSTLGLRNMYSKREIRKIEDIKGLKVRVQARRRRTRCSRRMGRKRCTCRSAAFTRHCRQVWSMWRKMA